MELLEPDKKTLKDNLTEEERIALHELTSRDDIIFKRTNKGGNFVIMDKQLYRHNLILNGHLNEDNKYR